MKLFVWIGSGCFLYIIYFIFSRITIKRKNLSQKYYNALQLISKGADKLEHSLVMSILANVALQKIKREHCSEHSIKRSSEHSSVSFDSIFYKVRHLREEYFFERASTRAFARMLMRMFVAVYSSTLGSARCSVRNQNGECLMLWVPSTS
jgi:hypothetical protein